MARTINFLDKRMYQGNSAAQGNINSDVFEVTDVAKLEYQLRVFGTTNTGGAGNVIAVLFHTSDPTFANWIQFGVQLTGAGTGTFTGTYSGFHRFARAQLQVPAGIYVNASLVGVARDG